MTLLIGCGALVSELRPVLAQLGLDETVETVYLPANLHNRPERIVAAIDSVLGSRPDVAADDVVLGYADCGTGGLLDAWLADHPGVARLPGAHCYEVLAGATLFAALHDDEPGTFYLTDFLARNFEPLVWQGLGLDAHPELAEQYFGNYRRLVLLSQADDRRVVEAALGAAQRLGLVFEHRHVGRGPLSAAVEVALPARARAAGSS